MGYEIIPVADIICFLMKIVKVYEMYINTYFITRKQKVASHFLFIIFLIVFNVTKDTFKYYIYHYDDNNKNCWINFNSFF